jgi:hypothetical protein
MAKVPAFDKAFACRWRIVKTDVWDSDFLDEVEEAHITFQGGPDGEIAFGALTGDLDVRYGSHDGAALVEFSGRVSTTTIPLQVAAGRLLEPPAASSATSTSTKATIQASSANAPDFFNSLLASTTLAFSTAG